MLLVYVFSTIETPLKGYCARNPKTSIYGHKLDSKDQTKNKKIGR